MKKFVFLLITALSIGGSSLTAQLRDKLVPHFGFMLENLDGLDVDRSGALPVQWTNTALNIGAYYTLVHYKDIVSLGIDPNLQFGIAFPRRTFGYPGVDVLIQAPVYAMARVGANATKYNEQRFGIGLGGGINYTRIFRTGLDQRIGYLVPEFVAEASLVTRGSPITGRIHFTPVNPQITENNGINYQFSSIIGFGLLYGF
ncbi:MAG: hypothetical protein AAF587_09855 [Bacteroidota bacterium]